MASIQLSGSVGAGGSFAILGFANVTITGNADLILNLAQYSNYFIRVTSDGASLAVRKVIVPLNEGATFVVQNATSEGFGINVIGTSGAGVTVPSGASMIVVTDGTNYSSLGSAFGISVTNGAALTALPTTGLVVGATAYVQTFGALWAYQPASVLTPDGSTVLAAAGGGNWLRNVSAITEAAILQALWVIDPANSTGVASDENPGTLLLPLKSNGEVARRMGTLTPLLQQATTIQWLTSGPASDPYLLTPALTGAGSITLQGTPTILQTTTIGVFTAKNRAAGTPATITSPGVPSWAALVGTPIVDTSINAIFFVTADLGAGTAQISEPVSNALGFNPAPLVPVNGDTIQLQTYQTIFAPLLQNQGDRGPTINRLTVTSSSSFINTKRATFNACKTLGTFVTDSSPSGTLWSASLLQASSGAAPLQGGTFQVTAGAILGSFGSIPGGGITALDGDVLVLGTSHSAGLPSQFRFGAVYLQGPFINQIPDINFASVGSAVYGPGGRPVIWGPAIFNVANGAQFFVGGGATAAQLFLNTGGLQLDGVATGSTFVVATGLWSAGAIALTPAAIDANGALQNPKTGSRFHN